jgi:hypothetical protein
VGLEEDNGLQESSIHRHASYKDRVEISQVKMKPKEAGISSQALKYTSNDKYEANFRVIFKVHLSDVTAILSTVYLTRQ